MKRVIIFFTVFLIVFSVVVVANENWPKCTKGGQTMPCEPEGFVGCDPRPNCVGCIWEWGSVSACW